MAIDDAPERGRAGRAFSGGMDTAWFCDAELVAMEDGALRRPGVTVPEDHGAHPAVRRGHPRRRRAAGRGVASPPDRTEGMRVIAAFTDATRQGPRRGVGCEVGGRATEPMAAAAADERAATGRNTVRSGQLAHVTQDDIQDCGDVHHLPAEAQTPTGHGGRAEWAAARREPSVHGPPERRAPGDRETPGAALTSTSEGIAAPVGPSGGAFVRLGPSTVGTSREAVVKRVPAERPLVAPEDVPKGHADGRSGLDGVGARGSRLAATIAGACAGASIELGERLLPLAAHMLRGRPQDLKLRGGEGGRRGASAARGHGATTASPPMTPPIPRGLIGERDVARAVAAQ